MKDVGSKDKWSVCKQIEKSQALVSDGYFSVLLFSYWRKEFLPSSKEGESHAVFISCLTNVMGKDRILSQNK